MSKFEIVDGDGHVTEPSEQLARYIDRAYRDYGPSSGARGYYPTDSWDRSVRGTLGTSAPDAKTWLEALDRGGMECTVLYPTNGLGMMVGVHATVRGPHFFGADLFDRFVEVHTLSHPFAQMIQMTSLAFRGVFEAFPRLKVAFLEAGCTWVPYWLGRMDEEWEKRG